MMKTIQQWENGFLDRGKLPTSATRAEIVEGLDIVAQAMMEGKATMAHMDALLSMRFALMSQSDKHAEFEALSRIGSISTPKKAEAARANGKKGGRPKSTPPRT